MMFSYASHGSLFSESVLCISGAAMLVVLFIKINIPHEILKIERTIQPIPRAPYRMGYLK